MPQFVNMSKTIEFIGAISDPIVKSAVSSGFALIYTADEKFDGDFDVHYFVRLLYKFCEEPERLIEILQGRYEDPLGQ